MEFSINELLSLIFVGMPFLAFCCFIVVKLLYVAIEDIKKTQADRLEKNKLFNDIREELTFLNANLVQFYSFYEDYKSSRD